MHLSNNACRLLTVPKGTCEGSAFSFSNYVSSIMRMWRDTQTRPLPRPTPSARTAALPWNANDLPPSGWLWPPLNIT